MKNNFKLLILFLGLLYSGVSFSQDNKEKDSESDDVLHKICQIKGSETQFMELVNKMALKKSGDGYYYLILFTPNICPRCEGGISTLRETFKEQDKLLNIVAIGEILQSVAYENGFKGMVSGEEWNDTWFEVINYYGQKNLQVPFLCILTESGKLVNSRALLGGDFSKEGLHEMFEVEKQCFCTNEYLTRPTSWKPLAVNLPKGINYVNSKNKKELFQTYSTDSTIVQVKYYETQHDIKNQSLTYLHPVTDDLYVFKSGETKRMSYPKLWLNNYYNKGIDTKVKQALKEYGILKSIVFLPTNFGGNYLGFASLPFVGKDQETGDLWYENKACMLSLKNKEGKESLATPVELNWNMYDEHFKSEICITSKLDTFIFTPIKKGWPSAGASEFHSEDLSLEENPYEKEFYQNAPLISCYKLKNNQLNFICSQGQLDFVYEYFKTGYSFCDYKTKVLAMDDGSVKVFYTTSTNGKINYFILKNEQIVEDGVIELFGYDFDGFKPIDVGVGNLDYLFSLQNFELIHEITSVYFGDQKDEYLIAEVSLKGELDKKLIYLINGKSNQVESIFAVDEAEEVGNHLYYTFEGGNLEQVSNLIEQQNLKLFKKKITSTNMVKLE